MNRVYIPSMTEAIGSYEAGQDRRQQRDGQDRRRQVGGLMASGDYAGAARSAMEGGDLELGLSAQKLGAAQAESETRRTIGSLVGAGDYDGAIKTAFSGGQLELGAEVQGLLDKADEREQAEVQRRAETIARTVAPLMDMKDINARRSYIQQNASTLISAGYTPEQLASFEPTDEALAPIFIDAMGLVKYFDEKARRRDDSRADEELGLSRERVGISRSQVGISAANLAQRQAEHAARQAQGGYGAGYTPDAIKWD